MNTKKKIGKLKLFNTSLPNRQRINPIITKIKEMRIVKSSAPATPIIKTKRPHATTTGPHQDGEIGSLFRLSHLFATKYKETMGIRKPWE